MDLNEIEGTPKTKFILYFIQPIMEWSESKGVSAGVFPMLLYSIFLFFYIYWFKSREVLTLSQKITKWNLIIGFILGIAVTVFRQIQIWQGIPLR